MYSQGVWSSPPTGPSPSSVGRPCDAAQEPSETPPADVSPKTWPSSAPSAMAVSASRPDAVRALERRRAAEILVRKLDAFVLAEVDHALERPAEILVRPGAEIGGQEAGARHGVEALPGLEPRDL